MQKIIISKSRLLLIATMLPLILGACNSTAGMVTPTSAPTMTRTPSPGQTRLDEKGIKQVWVPPGSFLMGSDEASLQALEALHPPGFVLAEFAYEQPQHRVTIRRGFWIDKYEVTNAAFQAFATDGGYQKQAYWSEAGRKWLSTQSIDQLPKYCYPDGPEYPRVCVTWYEAEAYANWRGGRLPTEAEWEYAARGPESRVYPWGNEWDPSRCNVVDSHSLAPVGNFPTGASWVGALDMAGNAMEWVQDWLGTDYYQQGDMLDPTGPASGAAKVQKGGWWSGTQFVARAAYRHYTDPPDYADLHIGFRVVSP